MQLQIHAHCLKVKTLVYGNLNSIEIELRVDHRRGKYEGRGGSCPPPPLEFFSPPWTIFAPPGTWI